MERKDTRAGRFYAVQGQWLPSATTLLKVLSKDALIPWAAKEERKAALEAAAQAAQSLQPGVPFDPEAFKLQIEVRMGKVKAHTKLMAEAADIGTSVHNRIEWDLRGEAGLPRADTMPDLLNSAAEASYQKFLDWRSKNNFKVLALERPVASLMFGFAGTLDLLALFKDKDHPTVVDWKTGKRVYPEAHLQNALYRLALLEEGIKTAGGLIVCFPKYESDGDLEAVPCPPLEDLMLPALSLIPLWKFRQVPLEADGPGSCL